MTLHKILFQRECKVQLKTVFWLHSGCSCVVHKLYFDPFEELSNFKGTLQEKLLGNSID